MPLNFLAFSKRPRYVSGLLRIPHFFVLRVMQMIIRAILLSTAFFSLAGQATAALILNAAMPITERVTVNLIDVANNDGTMPASVFGNAAQQAAILNNIDLIWAQAGIDIEFKFRAGTYNNTFANFGTTGSNSPRPGNDLFTTISNAQAAGGVLDPNPNVLNLFFFLIYYSDWIKFCPENR